MQESLSFSQRDHDVLGEQVESLQRVVNALQQRIATLEAGAERVDRLLGRSSGDELPAEDK